MSCVCGLAITRVFFIILRQAPCRWRPSNIALKPIANGRTIPAPSGTTSLIEILRLFFIARSALIVENLFLRKQLALFQERRVRPRRTSRTMRLMIIALAQFFAWREALVVAKPETFIRCRE